MFTRCVFTGCLMTALTTWACAPPDTYLRNIQTGLVIPDENYADQPVAHSPLSEYSACRAPRLTTYDARRAFHPQGTRLAVTGSALVGERPGQL